MLVQVTEYGEEPIDETELAGAAFLARYQRCTLEAYRYDLRRRWRDTSQFLSIRRNGSAS